MGKNLNIENQLKNYKKKRSFILFFIFGALIFIISFVVFFEFILKINMDIMSLIYLILALAYLIMVLTLRSRIVFYSMNINYFSMLNDHLGLIYLDQPILDDEWIKHNLLTDYDKIVETDYYLFSKIYKKTKYIVNRGELFLGVVVAKNEKVDFYSAKLGMQIDKIIDKHPRQKHVKKQIVLQFKSYEKYSDEALDDAKKIICFQEQGNFIINITIAYFKDLNAVYYLRPIKRYPNRYYFYGVKLIEALIGVIE